MQFGCSSELVRAWRHRGILGFVCGGAEVKNNGVKTVRLKLRMVVSKLGIDQKDTKTFEVKGKTRQLEKRGFKVAKDVVAPGDRKAIAFTGRVYMYRVGSDGKEKKISQKSFVVPNGNR